MCYFSVCDYNLSYYSHEEIYATGLDILDNLNSVVESIPTHELCPVSKAGSVRYPRVRKWGATANISGITISIFLNYMRKILLALLGKSYFNANKLVSMWRMWSNSPGAS